MHLLDSVKILLLEKLGYHTICSNFLAEISKIGHFTYLPACKNVCVLLNSLLNWLMSLGDSFCIDASKIWVADLWSEYGNRNSN